MYIRTSIISCTAIIAISATTAFAQTNSTTVVREAVPVMSKPIIANSPEDLALQEEIRKIRAYNAYVDSQVGVMGASTTTSVSSTPAPVITRPTATKIELFEPASTNVAMAPVSTAASGTTIIERQPVTGATSIYRIAEGDTLYSLSKKNCISVESIQAQNQLPSTNIQVGQVLTVPASQCNAIVPTARTSFVGNVAPMPANVQTGAASSYAVLPKDSLYSIGKRYCLNANELAVANGISTTAIIQPGQILQLPNKACVK